MKTVSYHISAFAAVVLSMGQLGAAVLINEIRPWSGTTGEDAYFPSCVELYNSDPVDVSLSGWTLQAVHVDGSLLNYAFPAVSIPGRCYLNLLLADTLEDFDFTDSVGTLAVGDDTVGLGTESGEVGLYSGGEIVDFVGWGVGSSSFGSSYTDAVATGQWPGGGYVEMSEFEFFSTLGRLPSGRDTNVPGNWAEFLRRLASGSLTHNPLQVEPADGRAGDSTTTVFRWRQVPGAGVYQFQIDDDPGFGSFSSAVLFGDTSLAMDLSPGLYYWRVRHNLPGTYPDAIWRYAQMSAVSRDVQALIYCPQRFQHKDSKLLCIYSNPKVHHKVFGFSVWFDRKSRPGCPPYQIAFGNGPWDAAHPLLTGILGGSHIPKCDHCSNYCTRASIQMINHRYGGSLTQDEISYKMFHTWHPSGPEGDLGHKRGAYPAVEWPALSWALMDAAVTQHFTAGNAAVRPLPWDELVAEITNDRPIMTCGNGHTWVTNGFAEVVNENGDTIRYLHKTDPWPGWTGWYIHEQVHCDHYHKLPFAALAGRDTDPNVSQDNDGDGVMNFDEGITTHTGIARRDFCSDPNVADTDKDELPDKTDIHVYTFCDAVGGCPENDPLEFPDIDGDTKRGECDCDSDNDADFDGGEEVTGDGWNPLDPWETCAYDATQHEIWVSVILVPGPVLCTEIAFLYGRTFHEVSTYPYEIITGCPDPDSGEGIAWTGFASTELTGFIPPTFIGVYSPGTYRARVDVLKDHLYSEPSNWDPWVCFQVPPHVRIVVPPFVPPTIPPFFEFALATLGISYVITPILPGTDGPSADELDDYFVTIWITGDGTTDVLTPGMAANLMSYLNNGGKLWMTGMNVGEWIYRDGVPDPALDQFYTQYLGAQYIAPNAVCDRWNGVPGSFFDAFAEVPITGAGGANYESHSPDEILPSAAGVPLAEWNRDTCHPLPGTLAAVGHEDLALNSRALYMPFAWESIPDPLLREQVMSAALNWLYGTQVSPPAVMDLTIHATSTGLQLSWSPVPGALSYSIYAASVPDFPLDQTTRIGGSEQPTFVIPDNSETKMFYVVTVHGGGESDGGETLSMDDIVGQTDIDRVIAELTRRHIAYRIADGTSISADMSKRARLE